MRRAAAWPAADPQARPAEAKKADLEAKQAAAEAKERELEAKKVEAEQKERELEQKQKELEQAVAELEQAYTELVTKMAEAEQTLKEIKAKGGVAHGALFFQERALYDADAYLPTSKQRLVFFFVCLVAVKVEYAFRWF